MKNRNILFIIDSLGIGGAEKVILTLADAFIKDGSNVNIISSENRVDFEIQSNIKVDILGFKKSFFAYQKYSKKLHNQIVEIEERKGKQFDLILVNLQKSSRLMQKFKHKNLYHVIHNTLSQSAFKKRNKLQRFFKQKNLQKIYNNLDIITVSQGVEKDIVEKIQIKPKTITTIYNPIDKINIVRLSQEKNPFSKEDYIIHVGRFHEQKRHDILLNAYKQADIKAKLILIGDGSKRTEIETLIKELELEKSVILTGFIQNPYTIIKDAHFLVLSSDYEGFGNVLVEALMLNTPVISTDCPSGPNEILVNELQDFLVPKNNIEALSSKIKLQFNNLEKRKIDIKHTNKFNIKQIIQHYKALISE
jgi:glycosyltransferase involved in cell wall biosynthesis